MRKIAVRFLWLLLLGNYRITDEALLAETTVVWPIFFLMNVFIALKGTHFFFIIIINADLSILHTDMHTVDSCNLLRTTLQNVIHTRN